MVINDTAKDETESITLPPEYTRATDIHSGKDLPIVSQNMEVTVPFEDAVVVRLEK